MQTTPAEPADRTASAHRPRPAPDPAGRRHGCDGPGSSAVPGGKSWQRAPCTPRAAAPTVPFIPVNCGAIPADLLELEIPGHEKGSFTGAVGSRAGMFQLANGGTHLPRRDPEMSPVPQVKARVPQDREVRPVGSTAPSTIDVRVIAATNKDLAMQVERGLFREDPPTARGHPDHAAAAAGAPLDILPSSSTSTATTSSAATCRSASPKRRWSTWGVPTGPATSGSSRIFERLVILSEDGLVRVENPPAEHPLVHLGEEDPEAGHD